MQTLNESRPPLSRCLAFAILCLAISVGGCHQLVVDKPLGEKLSAKELQPFRGTWIIEDGSDPPIEVQATKNDELACGFTNWDDAKQEFVATTGRLIVSQSDSALFVHFALRADEPFIVGLLKPLDDDNIAVYFPATDVFELAIKENKLRGEVIREGFNTTVKLTTPAAEVLDFIMATSPDKCFVDTDKRCLRFHRLRKEPEQ